MTGITVMVTGCAGFIGSHVVERLLNQGYSVQGIDNLNDYYPVKYKERNLDVLKRFKNFQFYKEDIIDTKLILELRPTYIIHMASMAGVRKSLEQPTIYVRNNIEGFVNIIEQAVQTGVKKVIYASSSSVYGLNKTPFRESDSINSCNSPYACSKYAMEMFAQFYHNMYGIPLIGFRFFTVYGPRGRPDMAPLKFLKAISLGQTFYKYGNGNSMRDYTYITDIVDGVMSGLENDTLTAGIFNLGNSNPVSLNKFIELCESVCAKKAKYIQIETQKGDVPNTCADLSQSQKYLNFEPKVELINGLKMTLQHLLNDKVVIG